MAPLKRRLKYLAFSLALAVIAFVYLKPKYHNDMCIISRAVDQNLIIDACSKRIQSGKLSGPDLAYAYALRARAARLNGSPDDAIADATTAIGLNPSYGLPYYVRAQAYSNKNQFDQSIADYNASLKIRPDDEFVYQELGHVYQAMGDFDRADENYNYAIKIKSRFSWPHNDRCWIRGVFNRDLQTGLAECNEALRLDPKFEGAFNSRGLIHLRLHNFSAAISDYSSSLACNPRKASSYFGRGYAELEKGDIENGRRDIEMAKSIRPEIENEFKGYGLELVDNRLKPNSSVEIDNGLKTVAPTVRAKHPRKSSPDVKSR